MSAEEQVKFVLRLPPSLHRKIKRRARTNKTSMNREITSILDQALGQPSGDGLLQELIERMEKKRLI